MTPEPVSEQQIEEALRLATKAIALHAERYDMSVSLSDERLEAIIDAQTESSFPLARALLALQARLRESERAREAERKARKAVESVNADAVLRKRTNLEALLASEQARAEAAMQHGDRLRKALETIKANGTRCGMHPFLQWDEQGEVPCPYCIAERVLASNDSAEKSTREE